VFVILLDHQKLYNLNWFYATSCVEGLSWWVVYSGLVYTKL